MFGGYNFDGMRGPGKGAADIDNKRYYELLGVKQSATDAEIKKAFRKKSLKEHPDKGGDPERFKDLSLAYKTLMDPQKRAAYDKYGEEGLKKGAAPNPQDFFGSMFGGAGGPNLVKKTKSVIHPIKCTLEDLYLGKKVRVKVTRDRIC